MSALDSMDIIKEAILLERRGKAFYQQVADQARDEEVKAFFALMAQEEALHIGVLEKQFTFFARHQQFSDVDGRGTTQASNAQGILTTAIQQKIAAADFEAAAISAAMMMEERAVTLYSGRALSADDPKEKALYQWLAQWEQGHLSFLAQIDKEIKEAIWHTQEFWPF
jgi:rubrerythrin